MFELVRQVHKRSVRNPGSAWHRARCLAAILVALLPTQQAERLESQTLSEQLTRVDSLRAEWERAREAFLAVASTLGPMEVDTIRAGPFTVLADEPIAELMNRAVPIAWDALREALGSDSLLVAGQLIHFPSGGSRRLEHPDHVIAGPWINQSAPLDDVVDRIIAAVGRELSLILEEPNRLWLGVSSLTWVAGERRGWSWTASFRRIYVELATSGSAVGRRCFAGDIAACRSALELDPVSDPATEWYDAADRRRLLQRDLRQRRWRSTEESMLCLEQGDDTACENLVHDRLEEAVLHPVSPLTHHALLETALQMGGDGAYGRMVTAKEPTVAGWIEAVANAPVDTVVARWHSEVMGARPDRSPITAATGWGAIGWILLLAAAAARSTRWRT